MVIRLTSEIETALNREAARRGTTPEQLALDSLGERFLQSSSEAPQGASSLFDSLSGYIGTVEGTGGSFSEDCGRHFAEGLVVKHRQGRV